MALDYLGSLVMSRLGVEISQPCCDYCMVENDEDPSLYHQFPFAKYATAWLDAAFAKATAGREFNAFWNEDGSATSTGANNETFHSTDNNDNDNDNDNENAESQNQQESNGPGRQTSVSADSKKRQKIAVEACLHVYRAKIEFGLAANALLRSEHYLPDAWLEKIVKNALGISTIEDLAKTVSNKWNLLTFSLLAVNGGTDYLVKHIVDVRARSTMPIIPQRGRSMPHTMTASKPLYGDLEIDSVYCWEVKELMESANKLLADFDRDAFNRREGARASKALKAREKATKRATDRAAEMAEVTRTARQSSVASSVATPFTEIVEQVGIDDIIQAEPEDSQDIVLETQLSVPVVTLSPSQMPMPTSSSPSLNPQRRKRGRPTNKERNERLALGEIPGNAAKQRRVGGSKSNAGRPRKSGLSNEVSTAP